MLLAQGFGRLGADASVNQMVDKNTGEVRFAVNFSIACVTGRKTNKQGEKENVTTWVSATWWFNREPKIKDYLKKGVGVSFSGLPSVTTYEDKSKNTHAEMRILINQLQLTDKKADSEPQNTATVSQNDESNEVF